MATNVCSRTRTKYSTAKELAEELGDNPFTDFLVEDRNKLNLERIKVNLKLIEIEKELLLFELDAATRD